MEECDIGLQLSMNGKSRVTGDSQERFYEPLGVNPHAYSAALSDDHPNRDLLIFDALLQRTGVEFKLREGVYGSCRRCYRSGWGCRL